MRKEPDEPIFETSLRALSLLDEIIRIARRRHPELMDYLYLLRHQLEVDEKQFEEAQKALAEFEEIYQKLTSPANRIATFLDSPEEGIANIAVGDTDYYSNIDPKFDSAGLKRGTRVKVNEAFAVVGDLGYYPAGPVVKVQEVLPDGRLRISTDPQGITGRIVLRSTDLEDAPIKPGDEVRMDPYYRVVLEHFPAQDVRDYYLEEVPEIPWSKIGGQEEAISVIRDAIELPLLYPELYAKFNKRPLKGILLYGPPGCGKTLIGKATAYNLTQEYRKRVKRDVREYFMFINGPRILNMWLGESERMVREIFAIAREKAKEGHLVFIFIDEAESILRTRSSGRWLNIANTVVPQFCAEMDGLVNLENVVVMLTSNRPDYIDPAILRPERIDRKVKVGRPDRRASKDILYIYLTPDLPLDPQLVEEQGGPEAAREYLVETTLDHLFRKSPETEFVNVYYRNGSVETLYWGDLVSGALLASLVERAKDFAIKRAIERNNDQEGICLEDMLRALRLEYKENEIFPKTDSQEDWLKLLDVEPENVVKVQPIRPQEKKLLTRQTVI